MGFSDLVTPAATLTAASVAPSAATALRASMPTTTPGSGNRRPLSNSTAIRPSPLSSPAMPVSPPSRASRSTWCSSTSPCQTATVWRSSPNSPRAATTRRSLSGQRRRAITPRRPRHACRGRRLYRRKLADFPRIAEIAHRAHGRLRHSRHPLPTGETRHRILCVEPHAPRAPNSAVFSKPTLLPLRSFHPAR